MLIVCMTCMYVADGLTAAVTEGSFIVHWVPGLLNTPIHIKLTVCQHGLLEGQPRWKQFCLVDVSINRSVVCCMQ